MFQLLLHGTIRDALPVIVQTTIAMPANDNHKTRLPFYITHIQVTQHKYIIKHGTITNIHYYSKRNVHKKI